MNKRYDNIMALEYQTRQKPWKINDERMITKDYLYGSKKITNIKFHNVKYIEEDRYLNIPIPFKQQ